jgi:hypothetical protein
MTAKLITIILLALTLFSLILYPLWGVQLCLWSALYLFIRQKSYPEGGSKNFDLIGIGYPVIETVIKLAIIYDFVPYSWFILNRIEHIAFGLFMSLLLFPAFARAKPRTFPENLLLVSSLVLLAGTLNEIIEYAVRIFLSNFEFRSRLYYTDTIYDLVMNLVGIALALGILFFRQKHSGVEQGRKRAQKRNN